MHRGADPSTEVDGSASNGAAGTVHAACAAGGGPQNASVRGQGTIDVDPYAMAVSADVSSFGSLSIRVDGTDYWELGAGDNGLAPLPDDTGSGPGLGLRFAAVELRRPGGRNARAA